VREANRDRSRIYQVRLNPEVTNDARIIAAKYIPHNSLVLDVGSACGDFGLLLHKQRNCEVHGMEFSAASIEVARETNAYANLHQVDLNAATGADFKSYYGRFDCIALLDVLEHLLTPDEVLPKLVPLLKKDGFFVISLPNVAFGDVKLQLLTNDFPYSDTGILDRTHLKFFTYITIARFLAELRVEIVDCSVKVADVSCGGLALPDDVKRYVLKDPHSFVYQYVLKASPSELSGEAVFRCNIERMSLEFDDINSVLRKVQRLKRWGSLFPPGSILRGFAKKVWLTAKRHQK
jgi:2-polyprenyl-3-methyl-5-hydroxy-6-metoxy-1,4-benzoquinol methylase